jgi:16S rRNA processing protein RimM
VRVVVARVGRALGVRGDLLVDVLTDEPERRLFAGAEVHIMGSGRTLRIESERPHGGRLCLHFVGIDDRSAAESLTGSMLEARGLMIPTSTTTMRLSVSRSSRRQGSASAQ